jgi:hypothetical protein
MRRKDFLTGSGLPDDNSPMSYVPVLLMAIGVVFGACPFGVPLPLLLYPRGARLQGS